jgi:hypothetical protein
VCSCTCQTCLPRPDGFRVLHVARFIDFLATRSPYRVYSGSVRSEHPSKPRARHAMYYYCQKGNEARNRQPNSLPRATLRIYRGGIELHGRNEASHLASRLVKRQEEMKESPTGIPIRSDRSQLVSKGNGATVGPRPSASAPVARNDVGREYLGFDSNFSAWGHVVSR